MAVNATRESVCSSVGIFYVIVVQQFWPISEDKACSVIE